MPAHTTRPIAVVTPPHPVRLRITRRPAIDPEPPYDDLPAGPQPQRAGVNGAVTVSEPILIRPIAPMPKPVPAPARLKPAEGTQANGKPAEDDEDDEDDRVFDPVRTPRAELVSPAPRAAVLARAVLEVLSGDRPAGQLARWATPGVLEEIEVLVRPRSSRPWAATLRSVHVCEPLPGVAEVAAVIDRGRRSTALAMRMEGMDGRWLLTAVELG